MRALRAACCMHFQVTQHMWHVRLYACRWSNPPNVDRLIKHVLAKVPTHLVQKTLTAVPPPYRTHCTARISADSPLHPSPPARPSRFALVWASQRHALGLAALQGTVDKFLDKSIKYRMHAAKARTIQCPSQYCRYPIQYLSTPS
jgi:hypothetical protein